jgi:hypothetical protein
VTADDGNQGEPTDEFGNKVFWAGYTVSFFLARVGSVEEFLGSKEVPKKIPGGFPEA